MWALRGELRKAQNAVLVPTLDVHIQQCESFISRSKRLSAEIDAQRVAEDESLTEARARLELLRSEMIADPQSPQIGKQRLRSSDSKLQSCQMPLCSRVQASHPVQSSVEAAQMVQERPSEEPVQRKCLQQNMHSQSGCVQSIGIQGVVAELLATGGCSFRH